MTRHRDRKRFAGLSVLLLVGALLASFIHAEPAPATHNRATQITWRADSGTNTALFQVFFAARLSYYGSLSKGDTFTDPTLDFGDGRSVKPTLHVTAVDAENDIVYAYTKQDIEHTYDSSGPFTASLSSCCRLSGPKHINNPDGDYTVQTLVDFTGTSASPTSSIAPIIDCPVNEVCKLPSTHD